MSKSHGLDDPSRLGKYLGYLLGALSSGLVVLVEKGEMMGMSAAPAAAREQ